MVPNLNLDYLAILVAGVVYFVMGGLVYSPLLFGRAWMRLGGHTEESIKQGNTALPYVVAFACALVNAFVIAEVLDFIEAQTWPQALGTALFLWAGFYFVGRAPESFFGRKPKALLLIDASYPLLGTLAATAVLFAWPR